MEGVSERWIRDAKAAIRDSDVDYFKVSPWIYWRDFIVSTTIAFTAASIYLTAPAWSWYQLVAFPIAVFWLYRSGSLIHEVTHLGEHEMRSYKVAWNLIAGVMMLAPSPFYSAHHRDHHSHRPLRNETGSGIHCQLFSTWQLGQHAGLFFVGLGISVDRHGTVYFDAVYISYPATSRVRTDKVFVADDEPTLCPPDFGCGSKTNHGRRNFDMYSCNGDSRLGASRHERLDKNSDALFSGHQCLVAQPNASFGGSPFRQ